MSLEGLEIRAAVIAVALAGAFFGGVAVEHKIADGRYEKLQLEVAQAHERALQQAIDKQRSFDAIDTSAALEEAQNQARVAAATTAQLREVERHVRKTPRACLTYGFLRVLDARVNGVGADDLPLPAGKSDDACAPLDAAAVASRLLGNLGACLANAEQLNALAAAIRKLHAEAVKPAK